MTQVTANRPYRYGVIGVRDLRGIEYTNYEYVLRILERHIRANGHTFENINIVTGGGAGVDKLVVKWCSMRNIPCEKVPPNIKDHGKPKAFIVRNNTIAAKSDELILLWDGHVRFMLECVSTAVHLNRRCTVYPLD